MQLTLRTLLAWLDDKLPPSEVREIGKQVAEVDYAKKLVDRIHKVTRQRRLTVPPSTGPDATDPNLVASYIDNELDSELVAEFEKKCLTSDVHLAEVSSVHQILSLIGQKAKVPYEARLRMYQLIKGREALVPRKRQGGPPPPPEDEPMSHPIQPWVTPPPPRRPLLQRYGPLAAVLGLMVVLAWSASRTLSTQEPHRTVRNLAIDSARGARPAAPGGGVVEKSGAAAPAPVPAEAVAAKKDAPAPAGPAPADVATRPAVETPKKADAGVPEAPAAAGSAVPAGAVALARKPEGLLLRFVPERREWVRITEDTPLHEQDRLLGLDPFRSTVDFGTTAVDLVGETEVWVATTPRTQASRLTLARGRLVLHGQPSGLPFEITTDGAQVTVTPPPGVVVGIEKVNVRAPGEPTPSGSRLMVHATEGGVGVGTAKATEKLDAAGSVAVGSDGAISGKSARPAPSWVLETSPPPFDRKVGEQLVSFLRPDREVLACLVEASETDQKDVVRLAVSALKAVGDVSLVVPLLRASGGASARVKRRAAIAALRSFLDESPDSAKTLQVELMRDLGEVDAVAAVKLIVGYTAREAEQESTYAALVELLGRTEGSGLALRALALDELCRLTGRDDLEYDPEDPEGPGLKAWRDHLRDHDLKPAPAVPSAR